MIIVDTNVLSEAMRERPELRVAAWLDQQPEAEMFTTAITKAEILYGIAISPPGKKRAARETAAEYIFSGPFSGRILPFEDDATIYYAQISAERRAHGREMNQADALIAAITRLYGATLATRNSPDFEDCGIRLVNPWKV
jgi:predicted nucleic acid-binding protein